MSEQNTYYREYVQPGRWVDPDAAVCGCRGSGWWVSELDTVHPCRFHEARPENHPDYDGPSEAVEARIERLQVRIQAQRTGPLSDARVESLRIAHETGVDDDTFVRLAGAVRLARKATVVLPAHRFEGLSRGRGWARKGTGDSAVWGERVDNGYRVGPGRWSVGGSDGFKRKGSDTWTVEHVSVGAETWTVAS